MKRGDEADEFAITGEDGKTYGLRSSAINLSKHLGDKVSVSGSFKAESSDNANVEKYEKPENEGHEKGGMVEAGDILVTKP